MNSKTFVTILTQWWADIQEIVDHLQVVEQLMKRTKQYDEIVSIIDALQLPDFPKLKEFVHVLHSAQLLNESWKNALLRECASRSSDLIIHTSNPEVAIDGAISVVSWSRTGLDAREWERIYKRSLDSDVNKLLK